MAPSNVSAPLSHATLPPGPRGHLLLGSLFPIWRDRLQFLCDISRQYGPIVRFHMGPKTFFLISHPDYIRHVLQTNQQNYHKGIGLDQARSFLGEGLLTSEGVYWRQQRRLIQPSFHPQRIEGFAATITSATQAMLDRWRRGDQAQPIDMMQEMLRLTLHILGLTLFGVDISQHSNAIGAALAVALKHVEQQMFSPIDLLDALPTPGNLRFRRALRQLDTFIHTLIDERRQSSGDGDVLSMLVHAHDATDRALTPRQIRDEIVTLLFAGHETTASTLVWTWLLLAQHAENARQLHDEVANVLGGRIPAADDLSQLSYTKQVVSEAMRLYPPVWLIPRRAVHADTLGGYYIPAGADVIVSPYVMHRHPTYWEDPDHFMPERFAPELQARQASFSYLPFGRGPRFCVGNHMGMVEAQLIVAQVAQSFRLRLAPNWQLACNPTLSLRPRNGLPMLVDPHS